jgi:hypothetical protein
MERSQVPTHLWVESRRCTEPCGNQSYSTWRRSYPNNTYVQYQEPTQLAERTELAGLDGQQGETCCSAQETAVVV